MNNMVIIEGLKARIEILKEMYAIGNLPKDDYIRKMYKIEEELMTTMENERRGRL